MDGHVLNGYSMVMNWEYDGGESGTNHDRRAMQWTMATLLALARRTGRIFIQPRIVSEFGVHFLWTGLDFRSVEELGIDFRETAFPSNPKAHYSDSVPFQTVARTAMGSVLDSARDNTMFAQFPNGKGNSDDTIRAWKFQDMDEGSALDAWWAMHTALSQVDEAELLLVNPHYITGSYVDRINTKHSLGQLSTAEKEIAEVYSMLRWCLNESLGFSPQNVVGRSPADWNCYGKGMPAAR